MQRIDHQTADSNLFGVGKPGFTGGNTTTGVPSTRLTPDWCNAIQEEIARAIEAAGITLDPDNPAQLAQAMAAMVASGAFSGKWSDLTGKPDFATVATTGAYADLSDKPDLSALSGYVRTTTAAKVEAFPSYGGDLSAIDGTPGVVITNCLATCTSMPTGVTTGLLVQLADGGGDGVRLQIMLDPTGSTMHQRLKWGSGLPGTWSAWRRIYPAGDAETVGGYSAAQLRAFDLHFLAGYSGDGRGQDIRVQTYGSVVLARPITITGAQAMIGLAPTGAALIVDVLKNSGSIYTTKPQIAAGGTTLIAGVLDPTKTACQAGDALTFAVTQVGSTIRGQELRFTIKGALS